MNGPLFVSHQNVADILAKKLVVDAYDGAAGIAENDVNAFFLKRPE
jgi:hypothetical protein